MRKLRRENSSVRPSAILCSDLHIREDQPTCRIDNYWGAQDKKINFIFDLAKQNKIPILIAGDVGHKPRWSCRLLEWFISKVADYGIKIFCIPGQHDLINHNIDLWESSGIGVLHAANTIILLGAHPNLQNWKFDDFYLTAFPYGAGIHHVKLLNSPKPQVAMTHQMIIENKPLWPGQEAPKGNAILKKFVEFSIVHSGDNHTPFVLEGTNNKIINPGSMMRITADQMHHKPRVYLWWADSNKIKPVYLPIEKGVVSREHIEEQEERDERHEAYITRMRDDYEIGFSYEGNLKEHIETNEVEKDVKDRIWEMVT